KKIRSGSTGKYIDAEIIWRQKEFQAPVKKNGCAGNLFCCLLPGFLCATIWPPVACGQKGGCYGDITGFKVDRKTTGERGKGSNGPAFAGAWETGGKHGKWRGCAASGVFGSWALYRVGEYTTVFSVHGCGSYCYESHGRQIFVDAAF